MARQAGPLFITGTIDDVVFYKMGDKYYMRMKGETTSTTKKRMSQEEHYPLLCLRKREFKQASQMVKKWYYTLPKEVRKHGLFGILTGKAVRLLRKGVKEDKIQSLLLQELGQAEKSLEQPVATTVTAITRNIKSSSQLSCNTPTPKHKKKCASLDWLSHWPVSEQGQVKKKIAKSKAISTYEKGRTGLYAGYYSTWSVSGWY